MKTKIMSKSKLWIIVVLLIQSLSGCSQDPVQNPATPYDGCCGTEPKIVKTRNYKVYIFQMSLQPMAIASMMCFILCVMLKITENSSFQILSFTMKEILPFLCSMH